MRVLLSFSVLIALFLLARVYAQFVVEEEDLDMFNTEKKRNHGLERPESFLSVIEKMMLKFPTLKSKLFILFKKHMDPSTRLMSSNPSTTFGDTGGSIPEPYEIYSKLKSIVDAEQMLREDMQAVLRMAENYTDILKMKQKSWLSNMKDLQNGLDALRTKKTRARDAVSSSEIDNQFAMKFKTFLKYKKAFQQAEEWEKKLDSLLTELFP